LCRCGTFLSIFQKKPLFVFSCLHGCPFLYSMALCPISLWPSSSSLFAPPGLLVIFWGVRPGPKWFHSLMTLLFFPFPIGFAATYLANWRPRFSLRLVLSLVFLCCFPRISPFSLAGFVSPKGESPPFFSVKGFSEIPLFSRLFSSAIARTFPVPFGFSPQDSPCLETLLMFLVFPATIET